MPNQLFAFPTLLTADRIKRVKQELNPNLSDTMLQPVAELDRPILVKQIGEGSVGE